MAASASPRPPSSCSLRSRTARTRSASPRPSPRGVVRTAHQGTAATGRSHCRQRSRPVPFPPGSPEAPRRSAERVIFPFLAGVILLRPTAAAPRSLSFRPPGEERLDARSSVRSQAIASQIADSPAEAARYLRADHHVTVYVGRSVGDEDFLGDSPRRIANNRYPASLSRLGSNEAGLPKRPRSGPELRGEFLEVRRLHRLGETLANVPRRRPLPCSWTSRPRQNTTMDPVPCSHRAARDRAPAGPRDLGISGLQEPPTRSH